MSKALKQIVRKHELDSKFMESMAAKLGIELRYGQDTIITEYEERLLLSAAGIAEPQAADEKAEPEAIADLINLKFAEDLLPGTKPTYRPPGLHELLCHGDILNALDQHSADSISRRMTLVLRHLAAHGRTSVVKGTHALINKGWRRTPLGGHSGSHFYLWWAPKGAPPVESLGGADGSIYIRQIRHHDDHTRLEPGAPNDYLPLSTEYLTDGTTFPEPWTADQKEFCTNLDGVRILNGSPGSGKTTALWNAVDARASERVLYVTWSPQLVTEAREHFAVFAPEKSTVVGLPFAQLVELLLAKNDRHAEAAVESDFGSFQAAAAKLPPNCLGPWREHLRSLYAELRAYLVGAALPDEPQNLEDPQRPRLSNRKFVELRSGDLGDTVAQATLNIVCSLEKEDSLERFFPGLSRAFDATRYLLAGSVLPKELREVDRIVVDEVQDLTPLEALVPIVLARRLAEARDDRRAPFLLFAGDPAQTVRPTGFKWGAFKDLLKRRLGATARETELAANVRSPLRISELVNAAADLYSAVPKKDRPKGAVLTAETNESTNDQIYYCQAAPDNNISSLLESLADEQDLALICLEDEIPAYIPETARDAILSPEVVKGRDFQKICVLDASKYLRAIQAEPEYARGHQNVVPLWKRTAADRFRVALSRATEVLLFLDIEVERGATSEIEKFLKGTDYIPVESEEILPYLAEQETEERVQGCIKDALGALDSVPALAWRRARQAIRLLGDPRKPNAVLDESLRREAYLTCARVALSVYHNLKGRDLLRTGADAAEKGGRQDIANFYEAMLALPMDNKAEIEFSALGDVLEALAKVTPREIWLEVGISSRFTVWKENLAAGLPQLREKELIRVGERLGLYYEALQIPEPRSEARRTVIGLCDQLLEKHQYKTAMKLLEKQARPPDLQLARCYEGLGLFMEAADHFERAGDWSAAIRCHRALANLDGALRCLKHIDDHPDSDFLNWMNRLRTVLVEKPARSELTTAETKWLRSLFDHLIAAKASDKKP